MVLRLVDGVCCLCVPGGFFGSLVYAYSVISVVLNNEFNVSRFQLMLPMTVMILAGLIVAPWLGPKLDKHPLKWFLLAGALLFQWGFC